MNTFEVYEPPKERAMPSAEKAVSQGCSEDVEVYETSEERAMSSAEKAISQGCPGDVAYDPIERAKYMRHNM
jgi:hypothetical protein